MEGKLGSRKRKNYFFFKLFLDLVVYCRGEGGVCMFLYLVIFGFSMKNG